MDVILRKASSLARACAETAARIRLDPVLKLSPYSQATVDQTAMLSAASDALAARMEDVTALHNTKATIRRLVGEANAETVNGLLAEREYIDTCIKLISTVTNAITMPDNYRMDSILVEHDPIAVQTTLQMLIERDSTSSVSSVEVPALSPFEVKVWQDKLASLRRRRADLMDELAAANLKRKITLPNQVVDVLRRHKIID